MRLVILLALTVAAHGQALDNPDAEAKDVRRPPSIDREGPEEHIYRNDDEVTIPCVASGTPPPTYKWKKDGEDLDVNAPNIQLSDEDGSLKVQPLTSLDEGIYQCFASNQYGMALSRKTILRRAVLGSHPPGNQQIYAATEGSPLKVPCQEIKSFPRPTYAWALAISDIDENPVSLQLGKRITIDESGNLYFAYVLEADEREGRLYKCMVFNNYLDLITGGSYSKIEVSPGSLANRAPSLMVATPSPETVLTGTEARLKCFFSGKPAPRVSWKRLGNKNLPSSRWRPENDGTELVIANVQDEDEGDYECTGASGAGLPPATHVIHLNVQSKPTFIPEFRAADQNATEGRSATFLCKTIAEPAGSVQWLINGEPISPMDPGPRRIISEDGTNFTIADVCKDCTNGKSDLMVVQCNASNVHGYAFSSGYLNVILATHISTPPVTVELNKDDLEEDQPKEIVFTCTAFTDDSTVLTIEWYKDNRPLYPDDNERVTVVTEKGQSTLTLDIRDLDKYGIDEFGAEYTCKASNGYSTEMATAAYTLKGHTEAVVTASSDLWWIIFIIIALLLLLFILLLCCCLCIQRNKGDTYPVDEKERANGNDPEKELADSGFHDYQRPEDNEPIKGSRASLTSTIKLDSDDDASLAEYGDLDTGKFNEDGSFIGQYATDKKKPKLPDSRV